MSVSALQTKIAEAIAANEAGDLATAETKVRSALMLLASMPNARTNIGGQDWDRSALTSLLQQIRAARNEADGNSYGIQRTKVTYARADAAGEY